MALEVVQDQQTATSGDENSYSSEEETDSECKSEPTVDSRKVKETSSNPVPPTTNSSPPALPAASNTSKEPCNETAEGEEAKGDDASSSSEDVSEEEEEEEATDSEPETEPVVGSKKAIAHSTDLPVTKPVAKPADSKLGSSSKKRSIETEEGEAKKRVKKSDGEERKPIYFQRVWSEEDEKAVLQACIDYNNDTGLNALDDKNALYESLKIKLSFPVTKTQFFEKMRNLKRKFENNLEKEKRKGEALVFPKSHDLNVFNLSKFVWGDNEPAVLKLGEPKQEEVVSFLKSLTRLGMEELVARKSWSRLSSEDKKSFEDEWEGLQLNFYSETTGFLHRLATKMTEEASHPNH